MFRYSKLSFYTFIFFCFLISFYISLATYINDPLQVWHKPFFRDVSYSHIRESAHARIRNSAFDSLIIGNSYSECTSAKKAGEILGGKFLNLSIAGSILPEKNLLLEKAFQKGEIKKVVYVLDRRYLYLDENTGYSKDWKVLYDKNPLNDANIYLNSKYILGNLFFCGGKNYAGEWTHIDKALDWEQEWDHSRKFGGFTNWVKYYSDDWDIQNEFREILGLEDKLYEGTLPSDYEDAMKAYLDRNIIDVVQRHPDTEFYLVISPVSELQLAKDLRTDFFSREKKALAILVKECAGCVNAQVYAFDDEPQMGLISDFRDATHYRSRVNHSILEFIRDHRNQITEENVGQYLDKVEKKALKFDFAECKKIVESVCGKGMEK